MFLELSISGSGSGDSVAGVHQGETTHGEYNFQSFLSSQLRRRGVEVSERNMDDEELKLMQTAKQEEVKKFIGAEALKCLPPHLQPSKQVAMKMRWVLAWKMVDDGRN